MADKEMPQHERGRAELARIVSAYDWGALGHVVDVGGGDGMLLIALLNEYPALRGTVVDLPETAETARKMLDAAGLAARADAVAGDYFAELPSVRRATCCPRSYATARTRKPARSCTTVRQTREWTPRSS